MLAIACGLYCTLSWTVQLTRCPGSLQPECEAGLIFGPIIEGREFSFFQPSIFEGALAILIVHYLYSLFRVTVSDALRHQAEGDESVTSFLWLRRLHDALARVEQGVSAILLATKSRTQREREIEHLRELYRSSLLEADVPEHQASQVAISLASSMLSPMTDLTFQLHGYHAVADIIGQRITTLQDAIRWLNDSPGHKFSCVINFPYAHGEQTAKDLFLHKQSSCLHGLWFDTAHQPGPILQPDLIALGRMDSSTMGIGLLPMHRQRLTREFARHAATLMTAEVYCQLTAYVAHRHPDPHQVTYLRMVNAGSTLTEDASESLPVYVVTQLGFGQHWPTHNVQGVSSSHKSGDLLVVLNPTASALRGILEGKHSSYPVSWGTDRYPVPFGLAVRLSYQQLVEQQPLATSLGMPTLWLRREPLGIWAHLQGHELQAYHAVGVSDMPEIQMDMSYRNDANREQLLAHLDALTTCSPNFSSQEVNRCSARGQSGPTRLCVDPFNVSLVKSLLGLRLDDPEDNLFALRDKVRVAGSNEAQLRAWNVHASAIASVPIS